MYFHKVTEGILAEFSTDRGMNPKKDSFFGRSLKKKHHVAASTRIQDGGFIDRSIRPPLKRR